MPDEYTALVSTINEGLHAEYVNYDPPKATPKADKTAVDALPHRTRRIFDLIRKANIKKNRANHDAFHIARFYQTRTRSFADFAPVYDDLIAYADFRLLEGATLYTVDLEWSAMRAYLDRGTTRTTVDLSALVSCFRGIINAIEASRAPLNSATLLADKEEI